MGRAKTVDVCLICDRLPCECNKKSEKKAVARPPRVAKPVVDVESPLTTSPPAPDRSAGILDAMKSSSIASSQEVVTSPRIHHDDFEDELLRCAKVLWPILHPDEQKKYADRFAKKSATSRLDQWKARVGNGSV